jgi:hypothetical protein
VADRSNVTVRFNPLENLLGHAFYLYLLFCQGLTELNQYY